MNLKIYTKKTLLAFAINLFCLASFAQSRSVSGTVTDNTGEPIIGVNIMEKGTSNGTISDLDGQFSLSVSSEQSVITVSYISFLTQEIVVGTKSSLNIKLLQDKKRLDELIVVGYGTMKKKDLTGSVVSVKASDIASAPVGNVAQALQGKLAGVNVTSQDGRPGGDVSIRIRGGGSISQSNEPLVLIDGVSGSLSDIPSDQIESIDVLKDASSTAIYGSRGANGVILVTTKGAEEGKFSISYNGYAKFNTPTKYLDALSPYEYLEYVWANAAANGNAYREPFEQLFGLGSANSSLNTGGIDSYRNTDTYSMQKESYNSSLSWNHDLTVSGGTDRTKLLFSVNYMDDEGMKINSYAKRANVSLKINQKLWDNVTFSVDTRYTDKQTMGDEGTTNGAGSLLSSAYRFRPIATEDILGDVDILNEGNIEQYGKACMSDNYSAAARIRDYEPLAINQGIRSTAAINWDIIKGLRFHTDITLKRAWGQTKNWSGAVYNNYIDDATGEKLYAGAIDYRKSDSWGLRWSNTLTYDFTLNDIHKFNLMAGQEITNSGGTSLRVQSNHFPSNFTKDNAFAMVNQYDADAGNSSTSSTVSIPGRIASFFGRANYNLLDRYLLTFTFRADQASNLSPDNRLGMFPAAAAAWRISEESFMKDVDYLDNLKLRLSFGSVGNNGISQGLWSQMWTSETDYRWQYAMGNNYQAAYDLSESTMANSDLKWETTITRDLGLDFGFLNSKLTGTIDAYWNTTKDLLMQTTIPGITGFTSTYANVGQTSNKGIELSLNAAIYHDRNWEVSVGGNINFNKNNVDELSDNVTGLYGTNWASAGTYPSSDYILMEGESVGVVRGLVYDGFYTTDDFTYENGTYTLKDGIADVGSIVGPVHGIESSERPTGQTAYPGVVKYKNLNDDNVIDDNDITTIGKMTPKHTGGFNINASYKSFDFGMYFNWSVGNDIYNVNKLASLYGYKESGVYENKLSIVNDCYKMYNVVGGELVRLSTPEELNAANTNASLPSLYNENGITSTLGIEDGSFLRLNTVSLGYTLPKSLTQKVNINKLRVYGSVYNVLTITGYSGLDPEVNTNTAQNHSFYPTVGLDWGSYPRARSFVIGININL